MIASLAILALAQMTAPGLEPSMQQVLHLCVTPNDPIEDAQALTHYGLSVRDEYDRYFNDLNAYLLCLQQSQADIIKQGNRWHERYKSAVAGNIIE